MTRAASFKDVAIFMRTLLDQKGELYQEEAAAEIENKFGSDFVYENENGNIAIHRKVLEEFRNITPEIIWERRERMWRSRESSDEPNSRMQ